MEVALLLQLILHSYDMSLVAAAAASQPTTSIFFQDTLIPTQDLGEHKLPAAVSCNQDTGVDPAVELLPAQPGENQVKAAAPGASLWRKLWIKIGDQDWLSYGLGIFGGVPCRRVGTGQVSRISTESTGKQASATVDGNAAALQELQHQGLNDWRLSGDPAALLPVCDLIRLVGIKHPAKPCLVSVTHRVRHRGG